MMSTKFPFKATEIWKERIQLGNVYVDGSVVAPDFMLSERNVVFHHNPKVIEPSVPDEIRILYEEEDFLAVYKPAPMPMHPGGRYNKNSLTELLKIQGYSDLRITHRLDAVTSGIVLLAKSKSFAKKVMHCFAAGKVSKTYLAKVSGVPEESTRRIESRIRRKYGFVFESGKDLEDGFNAVTDFEVVERTATSSWVRCSPITGRTHQIRLHLAEWGFPIIDDPIYGVNGDRSSKRTQNVAISLISTKLSINSLNIDLCLQDVP